MDKVSLSVLIVDDDPTTAAMLRGLLRGLEGFTCAPVCVGTGAAAREALSGGQHELVLLDYLLPDEDGLAILAAANALPVERRPVVIMLTGSGSEQVAVEAMKLGAKDYLVKGALSLPALRRAILSAFERRRLEQQLAESTAQLRRHNAQLEADLAMAREVQQALLPQQFPEFPRTAGPGEGRLRFCHRWQPSHKVSGDFIAVIPVSAMRAGVFQCDVMGHGMRAALVTALLHGLLREQQPLAADPAAFLGALNRQLQALLARAGDLIFATAVYAAADARTGELRLANAGHPAPLHLRRAAGRVDPLLPPDGAGPALGLMPDFTYDAFDYRLEPGDAVLLATDGLQEAPRDDGEEFGRERLRRALADRLQQSSDTLLEGLLADVQAFRGAPAEAALPDDVCLVALDYTTGQCPAA